MFIRTAFQSQYGQFIQHVNTRWLSLNTAVNRTLSQYDGLKSYFLSQGDENNNRFERLHKCYSDSMTEVYLFFYQSALQPFVRLNLLLQREDPIVHIFSDRLHNFLKTLFGKFLSVRVMKEADNMTAVAYEERKNQLDAKVELQVLVIPHSNAEEKRVFSLVRKNKTRFRPSLKLDGTLWSIIQIKLANPEPCHRYELTKEVIGEAETATMIYSKAHSCCFASPASTTA
uniref:HAT C-terminal dimerisation domain-containing protein n=1 Tax=Amphimedon queenslandica TaxID=400682 RepID=A0A1X7VF41_AMPQE